MPHTTKSIHFVHNLCSVLLEALLFLLLVCSLNSYVPNLAAQVTLQTGPQSPVGPAGRGAGGFDSITNHRVLARSTADQSTAIEAFLSQQGTGGILGYQVPCGAYNYATAQVSSATAAGQAFGLTGQHRDCVIFNYTGSATVNAGFTFRGTGSGAATGWAIRDHTFEATGSNATWAVDLTGSTGVMDNVAFGNANSTSGGCLNAYVVGMTLNNLVCDGSHGGRPFNGFRFYGPNGVWAATTTTTIATPTCQNIGGGICLDLADVGGIFVSGAQLSHAGMLLHIGLHSNGNTIAATLLEGPTGPYTAVLEGTNNHLLDVTSLGCIHITSTSKQEVIDGGAVSCLVIDPGATGTVVRNANISTAYITDNAKDTEYSNNFEQSTGNSVINFPMVRRTYPVRGVLGGATSDYGTHLEGSWLTDGTATPVRLEPTILVSGKAWHMTFHGGCFLREYSPCVVLPHDISIDETSNVIKFPSGESLTFTIDPKTKHLQMAGSVSSNNIGYSGQIEFVPESNISAGSGSPVSAAYVGGVQIGPARAHSCSSLNRGEFNYIQGNSRTKDTVQVCAQDARGVYAWRTIY